MTAIEEWPARPSWPTAGRYGRPITARQRAFLDSLDAACGTEDGWRRHQTGREIPCRDCTAAHEAHLRALDDARPDDCGTNKGWQRHRRRGEEPCPPCAEARAAHEASKCGTYAGVQIHVRKHEPLCPACSEANAAYQRQQSEAKPEQYRAYQKTYYDRHAEERREASRRYRAARRTTA